MEQEDSSPYCCFCFCFFVFLNHYALVNQANWCNITFTFGNLFPSHSYFGWPKSSPHRDLNQGSQIERQLTYQVSHPSPSLLLIIVNNYFLVNINYYDYYAFSSRKFNTSFHKKPIPFLTVISWANYIASFNYQALAISAYKVYCRVTTTDNKLLHYLK